MWLCTTDGFYSIVLKDGPADRPFCVRGRVKNDLKNFLNIINKNHYQVFNSDRSDYRYRSFIGLDDFKNFFVYQAENLNYNNFKNAISEKESSHLRAHIYMDVWSTLFDLRDIDDKDILNG